ncbi:MAG: S8 family serine peptidase, partial [Patescibacteria group bacterium]
TRGVVFVAAVGNEPGGGVNMDKSPIYPACFGIDKPGDLVIGVAATTKTDAKAEFSNYGKQCTDISAPGEDIFSLLYHEPNWSGFTNEYGGSWSGTSVSAPMVSGAVALLKAKYPTLGPKEIPLILQFAVDPINESKSYEIGTLGAGRLNIKKALEIAVNFVPAQWGYEQNIESRTSASNIAVAPEGALEPMVRIFSPQGELYKSFLAYDKNFRGGVRLAMGDVDNDGDVEIITVPGKGGPAHVRIFKQDGRFVRDFFAFDVSQSAGYFVATGDLDNDGIEDIVVSEDQGQGRVRIFASRNGQTEFQPYQNDNVSVRIAVGDVDGDGQKELVTVPGPGFEPRGVIYDGSTGDMEASFLAYDEHYQNGVYVSVGDLDGNGQAEIVTGTDNGGGPHTRIFNGSGKVIGTFFAYDEMFRGGVRLSTGKFGDTCSIVTAAGPGGGPHVRVFNGHGKVIGGFFSDKEADRSGINIAAWSP